MNISELRQQQKEEYIKNNDLEQSYINPDVLFRCRPLLPEVKIVGKDNNSNIIFFEETSGSLTKRFYKQFDKANSFNLIVFNGEKSELVTNEYLTTAKIEFNEGYNLEMITNFINSKNKRYNPLQHDKRKKCSFYLSENEIKLVKEFLGKIRKLKNESC